MVNLLSVESIVGKLVSLPFFVMLVNLLDSSSILEV